jgi:hypothetical protein
MMLRVLWMCGFVVCALLGPYSAAAEPSDEPQAPSSRRFSGLLSAGLGGGTLGVAAGSTLQSAYWLSPSLGVGAALIGHAHFGYARSALGGAVVPTFAYRSRFLGSGWLFAIGPGYAYERRSVLVPDSAVGARIGRFHALAATATVAHLHWGRPLLGGLGLRATYLYPLSKPSGDFGHAEPHLFLLLEGLGGLASSESTSP